MAKVSGNYSSVTRGVSQQAPADRLEGQHGEQLNMLADPVRGLVRRNGFVLEQEQVEPFSADPSDALVDSFSFRRFSYRDGEVDHDILYRSRERVGTVTDAHLPTLTVYDKDAEAFLPVRRPVTDAILDLYESGGISAVAAIGSYVLFASASVAPSYNVEQGLDNLGWANTAAVWIMQGSSARTYTIRVTRASTGVQYTVSYQTPVAAYQESLNLIGAVPIEAIGTPFENYFINFAQQQYDNAKNAYEAAAAQAIIPSNIAAELASRLNTSAFGGWVARGSHLFNDDVSYLEVLDGADNTYARGVLKTISEVADVTRMHRVGKVIQVKPSADADPYYLKAEAENPGDGSPFQTVIWREAAGIIQRPAQVFAFGRRVNSTFYWASDPTALAALILAEEGVTVDAPAYSESTAGDTTTLKPPRFFGRRVTGLTVFQDRLLVMTGSTVTASKVGDYLNFYRGSMVTLTADDATEFYAKGTEDDTIRQSVLYDGSLMLQGDKYHYSISGRAALDARAPSMKVAFSMEGAAYAAPVGVNKHVYLLKEDGQLGASRLLTYRAGDYQDSPNLDDASQQLRDYINGTPAEVVGLASPNVLFIRTEHYLKSRGSFGRARPWGLYVYQWLEGGQGDTAWDSWGAWEWSTSLGFPIGISPVSSGDSILIYTVAYGAGPDGQRARAINVLKASARTDPTGLPYLDGLRTAASAETAGMFTQNAVQAVKDVVWTSPGAGHSYDPVPAFTDADRLTGLDHPHYTVGDAPPEGVDEFRWTGVQGWLTDYTDAYPDAPTDNLWTGVAFPAFVDLTNPFVRSQNPQRLGKAKTNGTLNITSLGVTTTRTVAMQAYWIDFDGKKKTSGFDGAYERIRYNTTVWVGRESKYVQVRLEAVDYKPLTINAISWKGNWYEPS